MKIILRIITALVCMAFLTACSDNSFIPTFQNSVNEPTEYDSSLLYWNFRQKINAENNKVTFKGTVDSDVVADAVAYFKRMHPDYFWINGYSITTNTVTTDIEFLILNDYPTSQLSSMHSEIVAEADAVAEMANEYDTDYEKILFVHDYIINNTTYDYEGADSGVNGIWGTAYGCLVNGSAICQGYAEAFMLIMNKLNIECGLVTGDSERGRHAWNYVKADGKYYWIDVTWDDPENTESGTGRLEHKYFLINDEMLTRTRSFDDDNLFVPKCRYLDDNYFIKKGNYLIGYDADYLGQKVLENQENGEISIMFGSEEAYRDAVYNLFELEEIWYVAGYIGYYGEIKYSHDDKMRVITINFS